MIVANISMPFHTICHTIRTFVPVDSLQNDKRACSAWDRNDLVGWMGIAWRCQEKEFTKQIRIMVNAHSTIIIVFGRFWTWPDRVSLARSSPSTFLIAPKLMRKSVNQFVSVCPSIHLYRLYLQWVRFGCMCAWVRCVNIGVRNANDSELLLLLLLLLCCIAMPNNTLHQKWWTVKMYVNVFIWLLLCGTYCCELANMPAS